MKFIHPHFGIKIDTDDDKIKGMMEKLDALYDELPNAKCLNCPGKCGVEADCCKVFSPPMNLIEFIHIMANQVEKMSLEQRQELSLKCIDSFVDPDYFKPCVLLDGVDCSVYKQRPLSCRLFGVYVEAEYNERSKKLQRKIPDYIEVPFKKQCRNLDYGDGKSEIFRGHSDRIFKDIHNIDTEFFDSVSKKEAEDIVMSSCTYMTFDAHYLSVIIGPEALDLLTEMKISLRKTKDAYMLDKSNIPNRLAFKKKESQVKDFLDQIKKSIVAKES